MSERTLVVLSGGLGQPSSTRLLADRLAKAAADGLAARGITASVRVVELREIAHEVLDALLAGFPSGKAREALDAVAGADGLIAVTPLFNTTFAGLFKTFVDVLDREALAGKPVLLGATGGTPRHSLALDYALRPVFAHLHAEVVPTSVFAATDDWSGDGDRVAPLPERIRRAGEELAGMLAAREPVQGPPDPFADAPSFEDLLSAG